MACGLERHPVSGDVFVDQGPAVLNTFVLGAVFNDDIEQGGENLNKRVVTRKPKMVVRHPTGSADSPAKDVQESKNRFGTMIGEKWAKGVKAESELCGRYVIDVCFDCVDDVRDLDAESGEAL